MAVVADITISLDGYVTGPNASPQNGLGDGGEPLHDWVFKSDDVDRAMLQGSMDRSGAVVMGRNLFDVIDGPGGWDDEIGYGADLVGKPPFIVVTHDPPAEHRLVDLDFTFVTDGVAAAIEHAGAVAGDRDVVLMGGGQLISQAVELGLIDELSLHISPVVLGGGTPLFGDGLRREMEIVRTRPSTNATHVTYRPKESS